jgi:PAS domain S-box-containing protein
MLEESSSWATTATTAITVAGGIIATIVTHVLTKRAAVQKTEATHAPDPKPVIEAVADPPTREALLALEEEIHVRRQTVNAYLNAQGIACWESDKHGACIFASDHLAELVGLDRSDVLGNGWVTNLVEEDRERVYKAWTRAVEQKRGFQLTYTFEHSDGLRVMVRANSQPIVKTKTLPDGTISRELRGMIGILTKIKEDKG